MKEYLKLLRDVLDNGWPREDRTGVGTLSKFGAEMRIDLSKGFPLLTTKKMATASVIGELLWFMEGSLDRRRLQEITRGKFDEEAFDIWRGNCLDMKEKNPLRFNGYNVGNMYGMAWRRKPIHPHGEIKIKRVKSKYTHTFKHPWVEDFTPTNETEDRLCAIWRGMRYEEFDSEYNLFLVADHWKTQSNFVNDAYCLWGFQEWVDDGYFGYLLDSDYLGGDILAPDTTIFASMDVDTSSTKDDEEYVYRPKIWEDQLQNVIEQIKNNPTDRRIIIDSWNVQGTHNAVLGVCHPFVQLYVNEGKLSCMWFQRSVDSFLGLPFNVASYALLTHIIAKMCDLEVGELIFSGGDTHIYKNHFDQVMEQLNRVPFDKPTIELPEFKSLDEVLTKTPKDFKIHNYQSHPAITAQMAV